MFAKVHDTLDGPRRRAATGAVWLIALAGFIATASPVHADPFSDCQSANARVNQKACQDLARDTRKDADQRKNAYWRLGELATDGGRWQAAVDAFSSAIDLGDKNYLTFFNRAKAYLALGQHDAALRDLDEAIRKNRSFAGSLVERGKIRLGRGEIDVANTDFRAALNIDAGDGNAHRGLADALALQGNWREAVLSYDVALANGRRFTSADLAQVYAGRARAKLELGDLTGAASDAGTASRTDATVADGALALGRVFLRQSQITQAIETCGNAVTRAIPGSPSAANALLCRGDAYLARFRTREALADYNAVLGANAESAAAYIGRGLVHQAQGQLDDAVADFDRANVLNPRSGAGLRHRALALADKGETAAALESADRALQIEPADPMTLATRAYAKAANGDTAGALVDIDQAVTRGPGDARLLITRARIQLFFRNDPRGAAQSLGDAVSRPGGENDHDAIALRGRVRTKSGSTREARNDLDNVLAQAPTRWDALRDRGLARFADKDFDGAIDDLTKSLGENAAYAETYAYRGLAFQARGRTAEAGADFESALRAYDHGPEGRTAKELARRGISGSNSVIAAPAPAPAPPTATKTPARKVVTPVPQPARPEPAPPAQAQAPIAPSPRMALVIDNGSYRHEQARLPGAPTDAREIVRVLERTGFTVVRVTDATRAVLDERIAAFGVAARGADWALVHYVGHGLVIGGRNHLVTTDTAIDQPADIGRFTVPLDHLTAAAAGAARRMVFVDAGHDNPFAAQISNLGEARTIASGINSTEGGPALIVYGSRTGELANSGSARDTGAFASALVRSLEQPGQRIEALLRGLTDAVTVGTRNAQHPVAVGSLGGEAVWTRTMRSMMATAETLTRIDFTPMKPVSRGDDILVLSR